MKKIKFTILTVLIMCFILSICVVPVCAEDSDKTNKRDDVNIRVEAVWSTFNPYKVNLFVEYYEINQIYEPLASVNDDGEIVPVLAESWEIKDNGKTYVFKIRKGVKFHNGEELKASDVAFTINEGKKFTKMNTYLSQVKNAEATGDYECTVYMNKPFAPFLSFLQEVLILNEKFYKEHDGELDTVACGTGPYTLDKDIDMNTHCSLTAFPDYWQGEAKIKKVNFKIITDDTTGVVSYMANEIDYIMTSATQYKEISAQPDKYAFVNLPTKHTVLIYMNHELPMFSDVRVRRALNYACDKEAMIQVAFEGYAEPAYLQGDERVFGIDYDDAVKYEYDLEKAKKLLTEAGYPPGTNLGKFISMPGSYFDKCAVVFQASLKEIGYDIEIVGMDSTAANAVCSAGDYNMFIGGKSFMSDFALDAIMYSTSGIGGFNFARYSNPEIDKLFLEAESEMNPEKRKEIYGKIVHTVTDDAVDIPMFHKNLLFAWNKDLNCVVHPDSVRPYYIYDWSWK